MSITILTPATSFDLTTTAIVQAQMDLVGVDNALFDELVTAASQFIVDYTKREWAREKIEELVPGFNDNWLTLTRTQIESINSISLNGDVITDFIIEEREGGILFREVGWIASRSSRQFIERHPIAGSELPRYKIDYWGGYVLPSHTGTVNLPASIIQAANELVRIWYNETKNNASGSIERIKVGDYSITFDNESDFENGEIGIPGTVLAKLRNWRRIE
jgi:hypothetical protein